MNKIPRLGAEWDNLQWTTQRRQMTKRQPKTQHQKAIDKAKEIDKVLAIATVTDKVLARVVLEWLEQEWLALA